MSSAESGGSPNNSSLSLTSQTSRPSAREPNNDRVPSSRRAASCSQTAIVDRPSLSGAVCGDQSVMRPFSRSPTRRSAPSAGASTATGSRTPRRKARIISRRSRSLSVTACPSASAQASISKRRGGRSSGPGAAPADS